MFTKSIARFSFVASLMIAGVSAQPGVSPQLTADRAEMSVHTGGWQSFDLHAGVEQAGAWYVILGSISGTAPGIRLYDVT